MNRSDIFMNSSFADLQNMVPHFTHVAHKIASASWGYQRQLWDRHSFLLVYDGEAVIGCNEERKVSKGHLVYFKPGDIRWGYTFENNPIKCYGMDFHYSCLVLDNDGWIKKDVPLPLESFITINDPHLLSRIIYLFQRLTREWISPNMFNKVFRARAHFMEMLYLIVLWNTSKQALNYDKIRKVEKVTQFILDNYSKKIKLEDLANHIQLSQSYLQVIFKEITGKSPIEYLITVRINKAKELIKLKEGSQTISEIAEQVGFTDPFYFSKRFKKLEGITPSEFQKMVLSENRII